MVEQPLRYKRFALRYIRSRTRKSKGSFTEIQKLNIEKCERALLQMQNHFLCTDPNQIAKFILKLKG